MTSRPRAAQAKLAELEKASAPLEAQLLEAAKFVGVDIQSLQILSRSSGSSFHAREEWVLRWILKKLQAGGDEGKEARASASSWRLLRHVVSVIPSSSTARTLNERKFMTILRDTLEEARDSITPLSTPDVGNKSSSKPNKSKSSRKRNRSGELLDVAGQEVGHVGIDGLEAVWEVIEQVLSAANPVRVTTEGTNVAFASEYMKSVFRTTSDEAARVLGAWLTLCDLKSGKLEETSRTSQVVWLSPFMQIWASRAITSTDIVEFTQHCLQPILSLFRRIDDRERLSKSLKLGSSSSKVLSNSAWKIQLEQLLARNVIIPSKAHGSSVASQETLKQSASPAVKADPLSAPILFLVAIRSLQSHGGRRRRANDIAWLQEIFMALKDSLGESDASTTALQRLLQIAVEHRVDLDLPQLRAITIKFGLAENVNWGILAAVISLDSNTFLIRGEESNLLEDLLSSITKASVQDNWEHLSVSVVKNVVVPLMSECAKARDLIGFAHHWYAQLVLFESLRKENNPENMVLSAWEDEALQIQFRELMEASLTVQQIIQLVQWLDDHAEEQPAAVCVLLCAIAGSISRENTADAVDMSLYQIITKVITSDKVDARYRRWAWRVIEYTIGWETAAELSQIWSKMGGVIKEKASGSGKNALEDLEVLAVCRVLSAFYTYSAGDEIIRSKSSKLLIAMLTQIDEYLKRFVSKVKKDSDVGLETCQNHILRAKPGMGWYSYAYSSCIMNEYPKVLHLVADIKSEDTNILEKTFRIASATIPGKISTSTWINTHSEIFPKLWASVLDRETVLNDQTVIGHILDVILDCSTNSKSTLEKSKSCNGFAIKCLSRIPFEVLRKHDRELIMLSWDSEKLNRATDNAGLAWQMQCLDPAVLSLKARMMRLPTFYEGIKFQDLVDLAKLIEKSDQDSMIVSPIFSELCTRVLGHVISSLDQKRSKEYLSSAIEFLRQPYQTKQTNYATIKLVEVVLGSLSAKIPALEEAAIINAAALATLKDNLLRAIPIFKETPGQLESQPNTDIGRSSIQKAVVVAIDDGIDQAKMIETLSHEALSDHKQLNRLLALRHAIVVCDDTKRTDIDDSTTPSNIISTTYSRLSDFLSKGAGVRQFCLISETMILILRTKPRMITQWNIDSTLSSISITCSRLGPSLSPRSAGTIYMHLCHLLQTILTSHRLKLQGHFHLLVQTMQALLRCLFTPLPHSSARITALHPLPPWLSASRPLGAKHAAAYTRLLTLICNPSVSSARQGKNALVSATDKAKRVAGQYMPVVLSSYVRLQLEMKMSTECREVMVQGLYAIFDTTTVESRRVLGESLDSSGRAVLGGLVRDYLRFGKWSGT